MLCFLSSKRAPYFGLIAFGGFIYFSSVIYFSCLSFVSVLIGLILFLSYKVEASTNQVADQQMPAYDLRAKILCRVINVQLKVPF